MGSKNELGDSILKLLGELESIDRYEEQVSNFVIKKRRSVFEEIFNHYSMLKRLKKSGKLKFIK